MVSVGPIGSPAGNGPAVSTRVATYEVCALPEGHREWRNFALVIENRGDGWKVTRFGMDVDDTGRDETMLGWPAEEHCAHVPLEEALSRARRLAHLVYVGNETAKLTAADILRLDAEREAVR